ncbi:hypothetical protein [Trueperella sp. LYQ143]|uniref:hypothetical protein n=1 Tax=unclassified Trueperella TaxID=2630174 RepID=UPI003983B949
MRRFRTLLRLATTAGPVVYSVIRNYGPQLQRLLADNPALFQKLTSRFGMFSASGQRAKVNNQLADRIRVLRDQAAYLYAAARTASAAEETASWRRELDSLHSSLPIIATMPTKQRKEQKRIIEQRIDELSAKILAATLKDDIEDAEIIDDGE